MSSTVAVVAIVVAVVLLLLVSAVRVIKQYELACRTCVAAGPDRLWYRGDVHGGARRLSQPHARGRRERRLRAAYGQAVKSRLLRSLRT